MAKRVFAGIRSFVLFAEAGALSMWLSSESASPSVFAAAGHAALAMGLAVANVAWLAFMAPLHGLVRRLGQEDLFASLKLMIASFIILPLPPGRPVAPCLALNPYKLWLRLILISALSLIGYIAMCWLGRTRGVALTCLAGWSHPPQ